MIAEAKQKPNSISTAQCRDGALLPRKELVTSVVLPAPPRTVWSVLTDGAGYEAWNPFITQMKGDLRPGGRLRNTMRPGGGKAVTFSPTILAVREGIELRWRGRFLFPGLFDGEHYFLLSGNDAETTLIHGEVFSGLMLAFLDVERFRTDFEAMNAALARRISTMVT